MFCRSSPFALHFPTSLAPLRCLRIGAGRGGRGKVTRASPCVRLDTGESVSLTGVRQNHSDAPHDSHTHSGEKLRQWGSERGRGGGREDSSRRCSQHTRRTNNKNNKKGGGAYTLGEHVNANDVQTNQHAPSPDLQRQARQRNTGARNERGKRQTAWRRETKKRVREATAAAAAADKGTSRRSSQENPSLLFSFSPSLLSTSPLTSSPPNLLAHGVMQWKRWGRCVCVIAYASLSQPGRFACAGCTLSFRSLSLRALNEKIRPK